LSTDRIAQIEKISELCRVLLQEIRSGHLADFSRFGDRFDQVFDDLQTVKDEPVDAQYEVQYRRALRDLERTRTQLFDEIAQHRSEISTDLLNMSKGRRGIKEYRKSLADPERGTKRGEG